MRDGNLDTTPGACRAQHSSPGLIVRKENLMFQISKTALGVIIACATLSPLAHADSVNGGKQAAEQCVKYQHARSDSQIASCCADMLDGQGGKKTQQECVKAGKDMVNEAKQTPAARQ